MLAKLLTIFLFVNYNAVALKEIIKTNDKKILKKILEKANSQTLILVFANETVIFFEDNYLSTQNRRYFKTCFEVLHKMNFKEWMQKQQIKHDNDLLKFLENLENAKGCALFFVDNFIISEKLPKNFRVFNSKKQMFSDYEQIIVISSNEKDFAICQNVKNATCILLLPQDLPKLKNEIKQNAQNIMK